MLLAIATKMSYEHCLNINSWRLMESIELGSVKFMLHEVTKSHTHTHTHIYIYVAEKS